MKTLTTFSLPLPRVQHPCTTAGGRLTPAVSGEASVPVRLDPHSGQRLTAGASVGDASARGSTRREVFTARTPIPYPLSWLANRLPTADASGLVAAIRGHQAAGMDQHDGHSTTGTASSG